MKNKILIGLLLLATLLVVGCSQQDASTGNAVKTEANISAEAKHVSEPVQQTSEPVQEFEVMPSIYTKEKYESTVKRFMQDLSMEMFSTSMTLQGIVSEDMPLGFISASKEDDVQEKLDERKKSTSEFVTTMKSITAPKEYAVFHAHLIKVSEELLVFTDLCVKNSDVAHCTMSEDEYLKFSDKMMEDGDVLMEEYKSTFHDENLFDSEVEE